MANSTTDSTTRKPTTLVIAAWTCACDRQKYREKHNLPVPDNFLFTEATRTVNRLVGQMDADSGRHLPPPLVAPESLPPLVLEVEEPEPGGIMDIWSLLLWLCSLGFVMLVLSLHP